MDEYRQAVFDGRVFDNEFVFNRIENELNDHEKKFKINWSEQAALDLERLISYIANENPKTAGRPLQDVFYFPGR
ncbi:MAG: hypothetical protein KKB51_09265 [Candidatus Riflebacteria bacterium]|nr:hypothetical protein [Candidatus Riflebacteria bacterium]